MPFGFFDSVDPDSTDPQYLDDEKKRWRPITRSPFKPDPAENPEVGDKWDDQPGGERPPGWLVLSGDLAWTATFASLTSNTSISTPHSVVSYGVFFAMAWQLWASQANYDIKFYTNDWWHRIFFILQLMVYGALASFTSDFDVFWGLSREGDNVYVGDVDDLTAQAILKNKMRTKELSFQGIALVLAVSRALLLLQYIRVYLYRRRTPSKVDLWRYLLTPISLAISMTLFFICFGILKAVDISRPAAIGQLLLWAFAMAIEILGHAFTKDDTKENLRGKGSITARLSTLTVIVLGEGLNGLCGTLRHSVNSLGYGFKATAEIACVAIILYLIWLLYFESFRQRLPPKRTEKELWFILHLPFHLCLILLLEGLKNTLLYTNLILGSNYFIHALGRHIDPVAGWIPSPEMDKALQKLDMSWNQQIINSQEAFKISNEAGYMQYWRWALEVMYTLLTRYDAEIDETAKYNYERYQKDDNWVKQDLAGSRNGETGYGEHWTVVLSQFEEPLQLGTIWVLPVAGAVIMCIGLMNYVQSRPRDPFGWYSWGTFLNKLAAGILLIALVVFSKATAGGANGFNSLLWFMPIIALILVAVALVDMILLAFLVKLMPDETGKGANAQGDPGSLGYTQNSPGGRPGMLHTQTDSTGPRKRESYTSGQ